MAGKKEKKLADIAKLPVKDTTTGTLDIRINKRKTAAKKFFKAPSVSDCDDLTDEQKEARDYDIAESIERRKQLVNNFVPTKPENIHGDYDHIDAKKSKLPKWVTGWSETIAGKEYRYEGFCDLLKRLKRKVDGSKPLAENDISELRNGLWMIHRATLEDDVSTAMINKFGSLQRMATDILDSITNDLSYDADKLYGDLSKGESAAWRTLCRKYNATISVEEKKQERPDDEIELDDLCPKMPVKRYANALDRDQRTIEKRMKSGAIRRRGTPRLKQLSMVDIANEFGLELKVVNANLEKEFDAYKAEMSKRKKIAKG